MTAAAYPNSPAARSRWIVERRGPRNLVAADRAYASLLEEEPDEGGQVKPVAAVFLTNRECPWTCAMCDLWRNTTAGPVPAGAIPRQIESALGKLPPVRAIKLYNSGSFFDSGAIPRCDWEAIARLCRGFEKVIVESHPRLIGPRVIEFASLLDGALEVAMGLETSHPGALEKLNKRFSIADFVRSAEFLSGNGVGVRTFLMVRPPFVPMPAQKHWLEASIRFAFDHAASVVSLIPTRLGNGAMEALGAAEPTLAELETAHEFGLALRRGRVFADTWDLERFSECSACFGARAERIARMNRSQTREPQARCERCRHG